MNQTDQDEQLANYLLGNMPEAEEGRLEAEYLADADAQERLAMVEDELVDAYVRNELSRADCEKLEARFLASPRGRQKLALARSLLAPAGQPRASRRAVRRRWLGFSAAAAVAVAAVLVLLLRGRSTLPLDTAKEQRQPTPDAPTFAAEPHAPPAQVLAFAILKPGLSRGVGALERVHIPAGATEVELELDLDADRHATYRVELFGASEQVRWRARGLKSRRVRGGKAIVIRLPVTLFRNAEYTLVLSPDEADATPVAQFGFAASID